MPRRRSRPRATAPSRSNWSRRGAHGLRWCSTVMRQWRGASNGTPEELPNIHHRKEYEAALDRPADYRITCIFVDKKYRRRGVTAAALGGAVDLIAQAGGGVARGEPPDTDPQQV